MQKSDTHVDGKTVLNIASQILVGGVLQEQQSDRSIFMLEGWRFEKSLCEKIGSFIQFPLEFEGTTIMLSGHIIAVLPGNFNGGTQLYLWEDDFSDVGPICMVERDINQKIESTKDISLSSGNGLWVMNKHLLIYQYNFLLSKPLYLSIHGCTIGVFRSIRDAVVQLDCSITDICARLQKEGVNLSRDGIVFKFIPTATSAVRYYKVDHAVLKYLLKNPLVENSPSQKFPFSLRSEEVVCLTENNAKIGHFRCVDEMYQQLDIPFALACKMHCELKNYGVTSLSGLKFMCSTIYESAESTIYFPPLVLKAIILMNHSPVEYQEVTFSNDDILIEQTQLVKLGPIACSSLDGIAISCFSNLFCAQSVMKNLHISLILTCCQGYLWQHGGFTWQFCDNSESCDFRICPLFQYIYLKQYVKDNIRPETFDDFPDNFDFPSIMHAGHNPLSLDDIQMKKVREDLHSEGWLIDLDQNEFMGLRVRRYFQSYGFSDATVVAYLPPVVNDGIALWHLIHDDADEEDVELPQLLLARYYMISCAPIFCSTQWRMQAGLEVNLNIVSADSAPVMLWMKHQANVETVKLFLDVFQLRIPVRLAHDISAPQKFFLLFCYLLPYLTFGVDSVSVSDIIAFFETLRIKKKALDPIPTFVILQCMERLADAGGLVRVSHQFCSLMETRYALVPDVFFDHNQQPRDYTSTIYIEAFRLRGGDMLNTNLYFLSLHDVANSLKLDAQTARDILYGSRQSVGGFCFRLAQVELNTDYFKIRESRITDLESKRNSRVRRSDEPAASHLSNRNSAQTGVSKPTTGRACDVEPNYQDAKIWVGVKYQATIPKLSLDRAYVATLNQFNQLYFSDISIPPNSGLFDRAISAMCSLGKLLFVRTGSVMVAKDLVLQTVSVCILEDFSIQLKAIDTNQVSFEIIQAILRDCEKATLKIFDGETIRSVLWSDIIMTDLDDVVNDLIISLSGDCGTVFQQLIIESERKRDQQWTIDDINALEDGINQNRNHNGDLDDSILINDLQLMYRKSGLLQTKRTMKDLVSLYCEFPVLFQAVETEFGEETDIVEFAPLNQSSSKVYRQQKLKRVFRCSTLLRHAIQKKDNNVVNEQFMVDTVRRSFGNTIAPLNVIVATKDDVRVMEMTDNKEGKNHESSSFKRIHSESHSSHDLIIDLTVESENPAKRRNNGNGMVTVINDDSVMAAENLRWMRRKKDQRITKHENDNLMSSSVIIESIGTRISKLSGTPFPYHFVILEALVNHREDVMSFDEMLKEAQKKYGACLYGRSHMLRSLDRLVAVGDLCIVRNGGSLILKITQTGKERFSKKVSDYEHSGMIMKWGRIGRIINKYCLYDMAVAILKLKSKEGVTIKDIASIMMQVQNYPYEILQMESCCLLAMLKSVLSSLESQGYVAQKTTPTGSLYALQESMWLKPFVCFPGY